MYQYFYFYFLRRYHTVSNLWRIITFFFNAVLSRFIHIVARYCSLSFWIMTYNNLLCEYTTIYSPLS